MPSRDDRKNAARRPRERKMGKIGTSRRAALAASVGLWGLLAPGSALAQGAQPAQAAAQGQTSDGEGELVIVTAQKREQVLLEVPQSVTVVGGETLERQQATNFQDYLSLVPGFSLEADTPGETRITLRGANTGGVASTVAV